MEIREWNPDNLEGALLMVGWPSHGLVGGVAAHYVMNELTMTHVASIYDDRMPPTVVVRNGVADSPLQIYSAPERCGPDGSCDKFAVLSADAPIPPPLYGPLANAILEWAKSKGVRHVVAVEGIPSQTENGTSPEVNVRGIRSRSSTIDLAKYNIEVLAGGLISSYSGAFVLAANRIGADVVALYAEARPDFPDGRAAAQLLAKIDPIMPNISLNPEPLEKKAIDLDKQIRRDMNTAKKHDVSTVTKRDIMYR